MQLLPSELKCLIAELLSPDSLAALARTHTAYQRVAERALYDTLYIHPSKVDSLKCMETLANNSEKAGLVRFLTIIEDLDYRHTNQKSKLVKAYLLKSLINMRSLSDFRVRAWPCEEQIIKDLDKILWSVKI